MDLSPHPGCDPYPFLQGTTRRIGFLQSLFNPHTYRASGLAQIAVSTPFRLDAQAHATILLTERCRYGTRDFASTEPWVSILEKNPENESMGDKE